MSVIVFSERTLPQTRFSTWFLLFIVYSKCFLNFVFFLGGKFRAWVATSENPAAGTDAVVSLVVYGDKGKSDDIILGCGDGKFESGNEDEFTVCNQIHSFVKRDITNAK